MSGFLLFLVVVVGILILSMIRQINQYERGIVLSLGRYTGTRNPGWRIIIPIFQTMQKVDIRIKTVDVPEQEAITRDNIPVGINAVIYYKVLNPEKAVLEVENFYYAVSQLAQITMRNIVGEVSLDELLKNREELSNKIQEIVDAATDPWGIQVSNVDIKDIAIPQDLKRTIAKEAEAEREKRAQIIRSEGEVVAAENVQQAAAIMAKSDGSLHIRTLQAINDLSSDQSNTTIWMLPIEVLRAIESFKEVMGGKIEKK